MGAGQVAVGLDAPTAGDRFQVCRQAPAIRFGRAGVAAMGAFQGHAPLIFACAGDQVKVFR
jgi:hypothetical protein